MLTIVPLTLLALALVGAGVAGFAIVRMMMAERSVHSWSSRRSMTGTPPRARPTITSSPR